MLTTSSFLPRLTWAMGCYESIVRNMGRVQIMYRSDVRSFTMNPCFLSGQFQWLHVAVSEHELDQIRPAARECPLKLPCQLFQRYCARGFHAVAARERDPVEMRPVQREHVGRALTRRAGTHVAKLVVQDLIRAIGKQHHGD